MSSVGTNCHKSLLVQNGFAILRAFGVLPKALVPASALLRVCVKSPKFFRSMGQRHTLHDDMTINIGSDHDFMSFVVFFSHLKSFR